MPVRRAGNWAPRTDFRSLVEEMAIEDMKAAERDALVTQHGYAAYNFHES
jgi:GDPmannose 4,6-dehydratase